MATAGQPQPSILAQLQAELNGLAQIAPTVAPVFGVTDQKSEAKVAQIAQEVQVGTALLPALLQAGGDIFHLIGNLFHKHAAVVAATSAPPPRATNPGNGVQVTL